MNQEKIWEYFQFNAIERFDAANPRLKFIFEKALSLFRAAQPRVMNIGIGNGKLEMQCVEQGWETFALDPCETAVERLKEYGIQGQVGYIEAIPYTDRLFDVVFASEVLEHLDDKQLELGLQEIKRVLKTNGYFIGTVPFNENLLDNEVVCPECGKVFHRWGHLQSFDKLKMRVTLKNAGFEIISLETYAFPDFTRKSITDKSKSLIRWVLGRLASPISYPNLFFIVQKV
ncbi:class I SAM-dependent methyltransferase [Coleofasciculus sp. FACHB-SPT36]|uniref:class I SAM-dependent methyltransferase n=1 Tax=Cyanophyceae TaxID=3028117 RepID=UPI00168B6E24|nr:class I SAM-dependent methyltransferase [Coleofasciculus sp. FACHB-SPT36]MBD2538438.1 class I SAM-dependent methyltransferase [Coleofasciculus sp. FACHB-SPT36]